MPILLLPFFALLATHTQKPATAKSPVAKPAAWVEQAFPGGVFATPPMPLKKVEASVDDKGIKDLGVWMTAGEGFSYLVQVGELKDPAKTTTSLLFSASVAGMLGSDSKFIGQRDLMKQGWPGLATTITTEGLTGAVRLYRTERLLVRLMVMYVGKRPADTDKFLDSVRLPGTGSMTEPGAELSRFPLGNTGLSALFPRLPDTRDSEIGRGAAAGVLHRFSSDYGLRTFVVAFRDLPETKTPTDDELDALRVAITEDILGAFKAKQTLRRDEKVGEEQGLWTEFTIKDAANGHLLVYRVGTRMVCVLEYAMKGYLAADTVKRFMHSVEIATP